MKKSEPSKLVIGGHDYHVNAATLERVVTALQTAHELLAGISETEEMLDAREDLIAANLDKVLDILERALK